MAGADVQELLMQTYGEITAVAQQHSHDLEQLVGEIGHDNLSPTEKARLITVGEILGQVTIVASIAHAKSKIRQAAK